MSIREFTAGPVKAAIASWAGLFIGPNAVISSTMGFFMVPLSMHFGISRTAISFFLLLPPIVIAIFLPLVGRGIDRWGARRIVVPGAVAFGVLELATSLVETVPELILSFVAVSIAASTQTAIGYSKVISLQFSRWRGLALGSLIAAGGGLGAVVLPQIIRPVIAAYGWRSGYVALGAIILGFALPILLFFLRDVTPSHNNTRPEQEGFIGLTGKQALHTTTFWQIFVALFLASMVQIGTVGHAFPMLTERGFTAKIAGAVISTIFIGAIVGQLSSGFFADRVNTPRIGMPYFACALLGTLGIYTAAQPATLIGGAFFLGLGQGAEMALAAYFTSRFFGLRSFANIFAMLIAGSNIGIGVGVVSMGILHDTQGSYGLAGYFFGAAMLGALSSIALLKPYAYGKAPLTEAKRVAPVAT